MSKLKQLQEAEEQANLGGGQSRIDRQHQRGKLTARERIHLLLDRNSFVETDKFVTHRSQNFGLAEKVYYGDGVVTGYGSVAGRKVCVFAQDFTVLGGTLAAAHASKIVKIMELAQKSRCPIIGLNDSGGARIQEGVESLGGYADIFFKNTELSGIVPQISLIMGPCAGGAVYSPALTDFVLMVENTSHMFITGPDVVKVVTKEEVSKENLGGASTHASKSGVCQLTAANDKEAVLQCRNLLSFLPDHWQGEVPRRSSNEAALRSIQKLNSIIPEDTSRPYDMRKVIELVADEQNFFELSKEYATNILTGFIRLDGYCTGVVANQPKRLAGCLDINASIKAARFIRFCDAFGIPILTFVDVPGFLPGVAQEHGGIIRNGAKLLYAYAEATVPLVTVITRKAFGGAYDVMSSKHLKSDFSFAFPSAEIAVMGAEGAVNVIFRSELEEAKKKGELEQRREEFLAKYREMFLNPWEAARLGFIDAIIEPAETRTMVVRAFAFLRGKETVLPRKKHGNIPL